MPRIADSQKLEIDAAQPEGESTILSVAIEAGGMTEISGSSLTLSSQETTALEVRGPLTVTDSTLNAQGNYGLAADSLTKRGFHYFFPYLWGDTEQLKKDVQASLRFKMVPPRPKGLATTVQGLGLGALLLVVLSGLIWFILWLNGSSFAGPALETHKNLSFLIELYLIGHGCMALLHFFVWQRKRARQM